MTISTKILAYCSLLCYLAVSSAALAHSPTGIPMTGMNKSGLVDASMPAHLPATTAHSLKSTNNSSAIIVDEQMQGMADCHQSVTGSEQLSAGACQIFCAALAVALTLESAVVQAQAMPLVHSSLRAQDILTRQPSVEPHPPK